MITVRGEIGPARGIDGQADRRSVLSGGGALVVGGVMLAACSPTVRVEAPERPIEINLNVNITQEVRVRIDRDLESLFEENDDIF